MILFLIFGLWANQFHNPFCRPSSWLFKKFFWNWQDLRLGSLLEEYYAFFINVCGIDFINDPLSFVKKRIFTQIIYNLNIRVWIQQNEASVKSRVGTVNKFPLIYKILQLFYSSLFISGSICLSLILRNSLNMKSQSPGISNSIPNYFWTFDYKVVCDFYVYLRFWINGIYLLSVIKKWDTWFIISHIFGHC